MSDLEGKRVLVAGGTGDVGEGIVLSLLERGATVVVPARTSEKGERLRIATGCDQHLVLVEGSVGHFEGADAVAATVAEQGPLNGVVASLGGWWQGLGLADVGPDDWHRVIADNLTSHHAVARAFVPLLRATRGAYIQILGAAAEFPVPNSSLVSITAAAVTMHGRALASEAGDGGVRIRQIMIAALVATRSRAPGVETGVTAREIGDLAADLIVDVEEATPLMTRVPRG